MNKLLIVLFLSAAGLFAQCPSAAAFPTSVATDANLVVAGNRITGNLLVGMSAGDTVAALVNPFGWVANMTASIDNEIMYVNSVSGRVLTVTRGCEGTTAALHKINAVVANNVTAASHLGLVQELKAVEASLFMSAVNINTYGADPTGVAYSTTAIDAASAAACSTGATLLIPAGTYKYGGNGLTCPHFSIEGYGQSNAFILLDAGKYLVDDNQFWPSFRMENLQIVGGAGGIRNKFTGVNSAIQHIVRNVFFNGHSAAAISTNASDDDFWTVEFCSFDGANTTTTLGVALSGLVDGAQIINNNFADENISVKLQWGNTALVTSNSCVWSNTLSTGRACIWIVPAPTYNPSGTGLRIFNPRFGNEGLGAGDFRILYADEGSGALFGDRLPSFTPSTGWVTGQQIVGAEVVGTSSGIVSEGGFQNSLIYTFTPNLVGNTFSDIVSDGTPMNYIVQCDPSILPISPTANPYAFHNILGPVNWGTALGAGVTQSYSATNCGGIGTVIDPTGEQALLDPRVNSGLTMLTGQAGFTNLAVGNQMTVWAPSNATVSPIADSAGGTDATQLTISTLGGGLSHGTSTPVVAGTPVWIDLDLKGGSGSPLTTVTLAISGFTGTPIYFVRQITVPAGWQRFRAKFTPMVAVGGGIGVALSNSTQLGTVDIGRVYVYQASAPVTGNQMLGEVSLQGSLVATPNNDSATGSISGSWFQNLGTTFTASGCSNSALSGGSTAGQFTSGTTGTCTVTVTMGQNPAGRVTASALHSWECSVHDITTPADVLAITATTTTTVTFSGPTVTADSIHFACTAY